MEITSIRNGLVIDHIQAGMGVKIFKHLKLENLSNRVALIMNAESKKPVSYTHLDVYKRQV